MNRMKELREKKGLTQRQLALELGITETYVSAIERGVHIPGFKLGKKIADYFGVTIDEMNYFGDSNKGKEDKHEG